MLKPALFGCNLIPNYRVNPEPANHFSMEDLNNMETPDILSNIVGRDTYCLDCGESDTEWASLGFGTLVCLTCAGFHRSLGTHITSVRSVKLDSWSHEHVKYLECGGNDMFGRYVLDLQLSESEITSMSKYSNPKVLFYSALLKAKVTGAPEPEYISSEWSNFATHAEQAIKSFTDNRSMKEHPPNSPVGMKVESGSSKLSSRPDNWVPDNTVMACMECALTFTMFFRRHHCRRCGRMVCNNCAPPNNVRPIPEWGYKESVRHCKKCYKSPTVQWKHK